MNKRLRYGVSLVALMITILVLATLSGIVVLSAKHSVDNTNITDFVSDLQKIEDATRSYYIEKGKYPYYDSEKMSQAEVLEVVGAEKRAYFREELEKNQDYKEDGKSYYYQIDLSKIDITQSKRGLRKNGEFTDCYVVNEISGKVYYLKGLETKDNIYFSISDKVVKTYSIAEPTGEEEDIDTVIRVSFDYMAENGTVSGRNIAYKDVKYGDRYGLLPSPSKSARFSVGYNANGGNLDNITDRNTTAEVTYRFIGWYKDRLFSSPVTSDSVLNTLYDHSLYAKWILSKEGKIVLPNVTRENYTFVSWQDSNGNDVGGVGQEVEVSSNMTLTASWKSIGHIVTVYPTKEVYSGTNNSSRMIEAPNTYYEVSFNTAGGTCNKLSENAYRKFLKWNLSGGGSIDSDVANPVTYRFSESDATLTATYADVADEIELPNAIREGYTFDGWYTDPQNGVRVGGYKDSFVASSDVTLYAHYTENASYKVEHYLENANDDNYTIFRSLTFDGPIGKTVHATTLDIDGFTYNSNIVGTINSGNVTSNGSLVLKIYYKRDTYPLTITTSGGSSKVFTPGNYKHGQTVEIAASPNSGSEFVRWTTSNTDIKIENPISATTTFVMPKNSVTITANLKFNAYMLTVEPSKIRYTGMPGETYKIDAPNDFYIVTFDYDNETDGKQNVKSKRTFKKWEFNGVGNVKDINANPAEYTFTSSDDSITALYSAEGESIKLPHAEKEGYVFLGWYRYIDTYYQQDQNVSYEFIGIENEEFIPKSDISLIALYQPIDYNVTVLPSGDTYTGKYNSQIEIKSPTHKEIAVELNANGGYFKKDLDGNEEESIVVTTGLKFLSWSLRGSGSIDSSISDPVTYTFGTSDANLIANYFETYNPIILPKPEERDGFRFDGWYSSIELDEKVGDALDEYVPVDDTVLYAKWEKDDYTLTVNPGNTKIIGKADEKISISAPEEILYKINLDPNGGSLNITDNYIPILKEVTDWNKEGPGTISKEDGIWKFTFGSGSATVTANYSSNVYPVVLPEPKKTGYYFEGWYSDPELTVKVGNAYDEYTVASNVTLYAKYEEGVARVNGTVYNSLQDAIDSVNDNLDNEVVELLTSINIDEAINVPENKNIKLDIGKYEIASTVDAVINKGQLEIVGESSDYSTISSSGGIAVKNLGTLNIDKVKIEISENGVSGIHNENYALISNSFIFSDVTEKTNVVYNKGDMNINGGQIFTSNSNAIYNEMVSGTLTLDNDIRIYSGSEKLDEKEYLVYNVSGATIRLKSGTIEVVNDFDFAVYNGQSSVIELGNNDGNVDSTNPNIKGGEYGIYLDRSTLSFYDGVISGKKDWKKSDSESINLASGYYLNEYYDDYGRKNATISSERKWQVSLTLNEGGTVAGNGIYVDGESVTVVATPIKDYEFAGWHEAGELVSMEEMYSFTIEKSRNLEAKFEPDSVSVYETTTQDLQIQNDTKLTCTSGAVIFDMPGGEYIFSVDSAESTLEEFENGEYVTKLTLPNGLHGEYKSNGNTKVRVSGNFSLEIILANGKKAKIVKDYGNAEITLYSGNTMRKVSVPKFEFLSNHVSQISKSGYEFLGWSTDSDATFGYDPYITQNAVYYAIYKAKTLYVEQNLPNAAISNGRLTLTENSQSFVRLRAEANAYKLKGEMTSQGSKVNIYSQSGWMLNNSILQLYGGIASVDDVLDFAENSYVGFINSGSFEFYLDEEKVQLASILDGYNVDNLVALFDGRNSGQNKVYSNSPAVWANIADSNYSLSEARNLTRGANYFEFNGNNSYVNIGKYDSPKFTIETVFSSKNSDRENEEVIIGNSISAGSYIYISTENRICAAAYINGAFRKLSSSKEYSANVLQDVALTYDGSILCLYINGELVDSESVSGSVTYESLSSMIIGAKQNSDLAFENEKQLNGRVYNVAVYSRALSLSEVANNYNINKIHIYGLN